MTESSQWYVRFRGKTAGPFTEPALRDMVSRGELSRMHEVSADGRLWNRLVHHSAFADMFSRRSHSSAAASQGKGESTPDEQPEEYSDQAAREGVNSFLEEASGMENAGPPAAASVGGVQWFYMVNNNRIGPVVTETLKQMFEAGQLPSDTLMWKEGMPEWLPAYRTGLCERHIEMPAPQQQQAQVAKSNGGAADGTVIAGYICCALSVLLCPPAFGIAAFVLAIVNITRGQSVHGVAQLILSIVLPFIGLIVWVAILAET